MVTTPCAYCLARTGRRVEAYRVVDGEGMCHGCFRGEVCGGLGFMPKTRLEEKDEVWSAAELRELRKRRRNEQRRYYEKNGRRIDRQRRGRNVSQSPTRGAREIRRQRGSTQTASA